MHSILFRQTLKSVRSTPSKFLGMGRSKFRANKSQSALSAKAFSIAGGGSCFNFSTQVMEPSSFKASVYSNVPPVDDKVLPKFNLYGKRKMEWYTGKAPLPGVCPGVDQDGKIHSLPLLNLSPGVTKKQIMDYFDNTWTMTEVLNASLQGHGSFFVPPPHNLRHPMVFYYGHTACLYINTLTIAGMLPGPMNAEYEHVFELGVDEMSFDDMNKNHMVWPALEKVHEYRGQVYQIVKAVINNIDEDELRTKGITQSSKLWGLVLGFEHERIHLETSACLFNEMPKELFRKPDQFPSYYPTKGAQASGDIKSIRGSPAPTAGTDYPINELIPMAASKVPMGKPVAYPTFGWDNEYGPSGATTDIPAFQACKYLITNGEFHEFVQAGGYSDSTHWSDAGLKWRLFTKAEHPKFWHVTQTGEEKSYFQRYIFDWVPLQWSHPAIVNFHEATAYAAWRQAKGDLTDKQGTLRLSTELEHHSIRDPFEFHETGHMKGMVKDPVMEYAKDGSGSMASSKYGMNMNLAYGSTSPVTAFPPNSRGFHDVMGNTWEWCMDYFSPLKGFEIHQYYHNFSTPCFDGEHHCIQGGSFISTGDEASLYARFHFRPHFFQQASFRLVHSESDGAQGPVTSDTGCVGPHSTEKNPFRQYPLHKH